jgi:hypothetical protein
LGRKMGGCEVGKIDRGTRNEERGMRSEERGARSNLGLDRLFDLYIINIYRIGIQ